VQSLSTLDHAPCTCVKTSRSNPSHSKTCQKSELGSRSCCRIYQAGLDSTGMCVRELSLCLDWHLLVYLQAWKSLLSTLQRWASVPVLSVSLQRAQSWQNLDFWPITMPINFRSFGWCPGRLLPYPSSLLVASCSSAFKDYCQALSIHICLS